MTARNHSHSRSSSSRSPMNMKSHRGTSHRGFAGMDPERQREIAAMGGRASHGGRGANWQSPVRSNDVRSNDYSGSQGYTQDYGPSYGRGQNDDRNLDYDNYASSRDQDQSWGERDQERDWGDRDWDRNSNRSFDRNSDRDLDRTLSRNFDRYSDQNSTNDREYVGNRNQNMDRQYQDNDQYERGGSYHRDQNGRNFYSTEDRNNERDTDGYRGRDSWENSSQQGRRTYGKFQGR